MTEPMTDDLEASISKYIDIHPLAPVDLFEKCLVEVRHLRKENKTAREFLESVDTVNPEELINKIADFLGAKR